MQVSELFGRCIEKLFSGKFILTIVIAYVFAVCAMSGILSPEYIAATISGVIVFYFTKDNNKKKGK